MGAVRGPKWTPFVLGGVMVPDTLKVWAQVILLVAFAKVVIAWLDKMGFTRTAAAVASTTPQ